MSTLKPRRFKFNRDVIRSVRDFVPNEAIGDLKSRYLARKLLAAYLLCRANSAHYPYSMVDRFLKDYFILPHGIDAFVQKTLDVQFDCPEEIEKGVFYLAYNKETKGISYAVTDGNQHHKGEILEEKYKPFKERLRRRGSLSLKEVNFLIEQVVMPRSHLPCFSEVHDPLSIDYFCDFLESDPQTQKDALSAVSHLKPFDEFGFEPPTELYLNPLEAPGLEPPADELDALVFHVRQHVDVSCCDFFKKEDKKRMEENNDN